MRITQARRLCWSWEIQHLLCVFYARVCLSVICDASMSWGVWIPSDAKAFPKEAKKKRGKRENSRYVFDKWCGNVIVREVLRKGYSLHAVKYDLFNDTGYGVFTAEPLLIRKSFFSSIFYHWRRQFRDRVKRSAPGNARSESPHWASS